jgi:signal transduction histidine kinase/ActR/RegA family two-component response regulator
VNPVQLAIDLLQYLNAAAALMLAVVAALRMRRGGPYRRWGAAAFAALAAVLLMSALAGADASEWVTKALVCVLLAFPYLVLRFTAAFRAVPPRFTQLAGWWLLAIVLATLALPSVPREGAARPGWFTAYAVVVVVFWTALSAVTMLGLWRGGAGQPTLARRRTRVMSAAVGAVNVLILLAGAGVSGSTSQLSFQILLLVSLASFAVGFAPPAFVRLTWRQPEQADLHRATEDLVGATTVEEIGRTLLPHVARVVGASGVGLYDAEGELLTSVGDRSALDPAAEPLGNVERLPLSPPFGALVVATSPLTPFFGREELRLLQSIAALADLTLARCLLSQRERDSQLAVRDAMEHAERANMAKSDFLSRMSHELRTPLNVVLGFGQILEMRGSLDEKNQEAVEQILKAGRHLLELINEVLDLSRIESGRMAISPEPVEIAEVAGEALDLMRPLAQERSVQLTARMDACQRHVTADRQRLKQVLLNLLSNAVKYNRDGGTVTLSCADAGGERLRLRVADTGPGIPAALQDRLFEPFERLGADQGQVEGTGLGLALSRQLVHLMGGEIGVDSIEGEGSTFWVELAVAAPPRENPAAPSEEVEQPVAPPAERRRVLLVEDNLANLKLIRALLADRPHVELLPAMTGRLGLELARDHRPDLILLDQHLPDLTGTEVLCRLKAHPDSREIPVVVVSADATPGQIRRMRELGAADYLTKPLDITRFLQVLDGLLEPEAIGR